MRSRPEVTLAASSSFDLAMQVPDPPLKRMLAPMAPCPRRLEFPHIEDERGTLSFAEHDNLPFPVRRCYWFTDLEAGAVRGNHGHRKLQQVILCLSGEVILELHDGLSATTFELNRPTLGIWVPSMMWRRIVGIAPRSVCLVLASHEYDEDDYILEMETFVTEATQLRGSR